MPTERSNPPPTQSAASSQAPRGTQPAPAPRPPVDRLTIGKLIDHGRAGHEFHQRGHPSYYIKILTDDGPRTIWGAGLERALQRSRTQPQLGDIIGVRENTLTPVSFVMRTRNAEGLVVASRQVDTPRPHYVVEKLEDFDLRAAAARAFRDPSQSRREAVLNHRELKEWYLILDGAVTHAAARYADPRTREKFVAGVREALAITIERGIEPPRSVQEQSRGAAAADHRDRTNAKTRE